MIILRCPGCDSEIAVMESEEDTFDIDCDCGVIVTPANALREG